MVAQVIEAFGTLMKAQRGEMIVKVTTATPLDAAGQKKVINAIKTKFKGSSLDFTVDVDPSILGGMTVQVGDQFLDLSARSKLNNVVRAIQSS